MGWVEWPLEFLLATTVQGKTEIVHAPAILDAAQLQKWLSLSVWALIGLNLFAFFLFVISFLTPQITNIRRAVRAVFTNWREARIAQQQAELERKKAEAEAQAAALLKQTQTEAQPKPTTDPLPATSEMASATSDLPKPPPLAEEEPAAATPESRLPFADKTEEIAIPESAAIEPPPPFPEVITEITNTLEMEAPSAADEPTKTEILVDLPPPPPLENSAAQMAEPPLPVPEPPAVFAPPPPLSVEPPKSTEGPPAAVSPKLPEPPLSVETDKPAMSTSSESSPFDTPTENLEPNEIPIFDPSTLDEAFGAGSGKRKRSAKPSKSESKVEKEPVA